MQNVARLIAKKRDGHPLDDKEIAFIVHGYARGDIPDHQMSALAMAIFFRGMSQDETIQLTRSMVDSGQTMKWSDDKPKVDKHSTGGIGDKTSIPLAPLLAVCGVDVPMISGRGLGPTGGTLDKLESIHGYRCNLSLGEFQNVVRWTGCSINGATEELVPADRKLYALRDVTATVPSIPLITASILSKKIAEGLDALILDVKWGSGAFMKTHVQALELARSLVSVSQALGLKTTAVLTDMNQPLGRMIGNSVEIDESIDVLLGHGPSDVHELVLELGSRLLVQSGAVPDPAAAARQLQRVVEDGSGFEKFSEMVREHGGDLSIARRRAAKREVLADESGIVASINVERIGIAIIEMGGGRRQLNDLIDHSVGIEFLVRIGQSIAWGEPIAYVYCDATDVAELASQLILASIQVGTEPVPAPRLVIEEIK